MTRRAAIRMTSARPWSPRPAICPETTRKRPNFVVASNGSAGCYGGWELVYPAVAAADWVRFSVKAQWQDLERGYDCVSVGVTWIDTQGNMVGWEPILPRRVEKGRVLYEGKARAPEGAARALVRLLMAWSASGSIQWGEPRLERTGAPKPRRLRLGAAAAPLPPGRRTLQKNTEFYLELCRQAANEKVDLLCLPELMLCEGMNVTNKTLVRMSFPVPGKEITPFRNFARKNNMALCFSVFEKNDELVHNTAVLINRKGELVGKYRKVHLAPPLEVGWGVTPGHDFPVFDLGRARVAMNICMDSSALESARIPARMGAEIICMPIMGDHRASTCLLDQPDDFDLDRWTMIQRMRAMDNHVHMVVSRNAGHGTGIFSPRGETLAISGGAPVVWADVDLEDLPRMWAGATFKGVCWFERREPVYSSLAGGTLPEPSF